jgi:hypothetical protein
MATFRIGKTGRSGVRTKETAVEFEMAYYSAKSDDFHKSHVGAVTVRIPNHIHFNIFFPLIIQPQYSSFGVSGGQERGCIGE